MLTTNESAYAMSESTYVNFSQAEI